MRLDPHAVGARIVSCTPRWQHWPAWNQRVTAIEDRFPDWRRQGLLRRALMAARASRSADCIVVHYDHRLATVLGIMKWCRIVRPRVVLMEFYFDISGVASRSTIREQIRRLGREAMYWTLCHSVDLIVVHTSREVQLYAEHFNVPASRFQFVPYPPYTDAVDWAQDSDDGYVLAVGRNRDYETFNTAMATLPFKGMVVAAESDRDLVDASLPANVEAHFEVPFSEYRRLISRARVVVIPLHANERQRAAGQVAMFEALQMRRPVIAPRTFQLQDYVSEDEVYSYRAGDPEDLAIKIELLMKDDALRSSFVDRGALVPGRFSGEKYPLRVLELCIDLCGA